MVDGFTKNNVVEFTKIPGKIRKWTRAPLPFVGQKKDFLSEFTDSVVFGIPEGSTVIELFGGSGLLSHTVKFYRPDLRVVWNDFDDYKSRLDDISKTNACIAALRAEFGTCPNNGEYVKIKDYDKVYEILSRFTNFDMITVSNNVLPVSCTIGKNRKVFYNKIAKKKYRREGYLSGVERCSVDFSKLVNVFDKPFYIIDPPYSERSNRKNTYLGDGFMPLSDAAVFSNFCYFMSEKCFSAEDVDIDHLYKYSRKNMIGESDFTDIMVTSVPPNNTSIFDLL